jgi:hypothetical protein
MPSYNIMLQLLPPPLAFTPTLIPSRLPKYIIFPSPI